MKDDPISVKRRPSKNEKLLTADGWRLTHTIPAFKSFHFERFVGRRRVAVYATSENTTARAWTRLKRAYAKELSPRSAQQKRGHRT